MGLGHRQQDIGARRAWLPGGHGREEEQGSGLGAVPGHQGGRGPCSFAAVAPCFSGLDSWKALPCANRSSGQGPGIQTKLGTEGQGSEVGASSCLRASRGSRQGISCELG